MNRDDLMQLAYECGGNLETIRQRLNEYFDTDEGRRVLEKAPVCLVYSATPSGVEGRKTTRELAIELLLSEIEGG